MFDCLTNIQESCWLAATGVMELEGGNCPQISQPFEDWHWSYLTTLCPLAFGWKNMYICMVDSSYTGYIYLILYLCP